MQSEQPTRQPDGPRPPAELFPEVEIALESRGAEELRVQNSSHSGVKTDWRPPIDIAETGPEYLVMEFLGE